MKKNSVYEKLQDGEPIIGRDRYGNQIRVGDIVHYNGTCAMDIIVHSKSCKSEMYKFYYLQGDVARGPNGNDIVIEYRREAVFSRKWKLDYYGKGWDWFDLIVVNECVGDKTRDILVNDALYERPIEKNPEGRNDKWKKRRS